MLFLESALYRPIMEARVDFMEFYQLVYLKAIYDYRSYTKAAAALNRTSSALTIAIQKLEAEFGVQLFNKKGRSIEPSEACQRLIPIIEQTLNDTQKLIDAASHTSEHQSCTINLGLPELLYFSQIIKMKENFAARGITVYVRQSNQARLEEDLILGKLDMAILRKPLSRPEVFNYINYRQEELCAYCPSNSAYASLGHITPDLLSSALLILSSGMRDLAPLIIDYFKQHAVTPEHLCNDMLGLHNAYSLAQFQNGICIAPRFSNEVEGMTALTIDPPLKADVVIAWNANSRQTAQQKELAQYILNCVPAYKKNQSDRNGSSEVSL